MWAEALHYSDVPGGVRIDASAYPGDEGNYLTHINDVPIQSSAQLRATLLDLVNEKIPFRSKSMREPTAAERAGWADIPSSVPPPTPAATTARWGGLAQLPGKTWYCDVSEPENWIKRRRAAYGEGYGGGLTQARMTVARWIIPDEVMELRVNQSGVSWTDRIERLADGRLHMTTSGLSAFTDLMGTVTPNGTVYFPLGRNPKWKGFNATMNFLSFQPAGPKVITLLSNSDTAAFSDASSMTAHCHMEEFDEVKAPRMARNLAYIREQDRKWEAAAQSTREYTAQLRAEGAQMLANMQASAMREVVVGIPQAVADVQYREAELDRLRRAAEEETRMKNAGREMGGGVGIDRAARTAAAAPSNGGVPPTGSQGSVHLYCYNWAEQPSGERTTYVSQVGGVPKTASNPEIEGHTTQRWQDYLRSQNIAIMTYSGCRLDTDVAYNSQNRDSFIKTALSEGTLRQLGWAP